MTRVGRALAALSVVAATAAPAAAEIDPSAISPIVADVLAGRHQDAIGKLSALSEFTGQAEAFVALTRALVDRGAVPAARAIASGAARSWLSVGDVQGALELLEALEEETGRQGIEDLLGRARVHAQRHAAAIAPLEEALSRRPDDLESRYYLASALWETGRFEDAEASFRAGLAALDSRREGPGDWVWHQQLGRLLTWLGRYEEAVEILGVALRVAPGAADLALDFAQAVDGAGGESVEAYRRAAALAPSSSHAHYGLARALRAAGRPEEALRAIEIYQRLYREERARTHDTSVVRARLDQGWDRLRRGAFTAALETFEALGDLTEALRGVAAAQRGIGDLEAAIGTLERVVASAPDDETARRELEAMRLTQGPSS